MAERLVLHSTPEPMSGCLLWLGATDGGGRYGCIRIGGPKGETRPAHVVAWEEQNGPVPDGLVLDHVRARGCSSTLCINVDHLEPVTQRENILRGDGPRLTSERYGGSDRA